MNLTNEDIIKKNFSRNIRYLRLSRTPKLSQKMLARILGVTVRSISRYESADCLPTSYVLVTMATYFGYTTDELLSEKLPFMKGSERYNENLTSGNQAQNT
ncbi:MAG: helix-turn-helix transcriptional regulator [Lachnospiraceae bacterium]|nr:helix-turn-helix transcriptional regulator [Lachnospiraceae bacterium]